jgi:hypothetical protein
MISRPSGPPTRRDFGLIAKSDLASCNRRFIDFNLRPMHHTKVLKIEAV